MSEEDLKPEDKLILFIEYLKERNILYMVKSRTSCDLLNTFITKSESWHCWGVFLPVELKKYFFHKFGSQISDDWFYYIKKYIDE